MAKSIKVLVKENSSKAVQTALINSLSRSLRQLNSEDYNYASILSSISLFESYAKLAATYLGMNVEVKFTIGHSSKGRVNMLNTTVPRVNIKDINAAFRSNYNILVNFVAQVEAIYLNAFKDYEKLVHTFNLEVSEYNDSVNEWIDNVNELTDALSNAGVSNEEIQEVLDEAKEETEDQIEENIRDAEDLAQDVWDTNKGYETSSQIQEDAIKAAEEYAENSAQAHAAAEAEAKLSEANNELSKAEEAMNMANNDWDKAFEEAEKAQAERLEADADFRSELGHVNGLTQAINNTEDYDPDKTTVGDLKSGTSLTEDGNTVVTVTHNGDGTTTVTTESADGTHTSVTYSDTDNAKSTLDDASEKSDQAAQAAQAAAENAEQKQAAANEAYDKLTESLNDYKEALTNQAEAQNAYDDASIPYATDDELETGWDGSNNTEDDYGEDNWGDWSDIVGEGIEDSGDEDDSEDTED